MPEFARGLRLEVVDRDGFEQFVKENGHDPAVQLEAWGHDSVPESLYIERYNRVDHDKDPNWYDTYDNHVNGVVSSNGWAEPLLEAAIEEGFLENTGEYNVEFVEEQQ